MINVSAEFRETLNTRTDFEEYADVAFADGTTLTLGPANFTVRNNYVVDGAGANSFPLGNAIQKRIQIEIMNDFGQYDDIGFYGARIKLYLKFRLSNSVETVEKGLYTVTEPETLGETIIVTAYDDMYKADATYTTGIRFPATLQDMLVDICDTLSIPLLSTRFNNMGFEVPALPEEDYTFRQIISYIAMIAGGNARVDNKGYLEIISYSKGATPTQTLSNWKSLTADAGDITITGVKTTYSVEGETVEVMAGEPGYMITVDNPLISGDPKAAVELISEIITGLTFRKFNGTHIANPVVEFMDTIAVQDRKGNVYTSIVTDVDFELCGLTTVSNRASSAIRNNAVYSSPESKAEIKANIAIAAERTARELSIANLQQALNSSSGMYETHVTMEDGSTVYYFHNKPTIEESATVIKFAAEGIGVSVDGGKTYPYGFTVTGEMVARILSADGINADWITTGAIRSTDFSMGYLDKFYPSVRLFPADDLYPSNGEQIIKGMEIDFDSHTIRGVFWTIPLEALTERVEQLEKTVKKLTTSPPYPVSVINKDEIGG